MALDENGLSIPTLQEIKAQLAEDLQTNIGLPLDVSERAVAGIVNSIFSAAVSNTYELLQAIYAQRTLETAEGVNLDDLVAYTKTYRLEASESYSDVVYFSGDEGTNIIQGALVENPATKEKFKTTAPIVITSNNAHRVTYFVSSVENNTDYNISINGSTSIYTSSAAATADEILAGLEAEFSGSTGYSVTKVGETLEIVSGFEDVPMNVIATTFLTAESVTTIGGLIATKTGVISAPIGSVTKILSPVAGWTEVYNPQAFLIGRDRETDEELRERQQESTGVSKLGTVDGITSAVRALSGVSRAFVLENDTNEIDSDLRPPKSYEVIVSGGDDDEIAAALWKSKPATIEMVGTNLVETPDIDGINRVVRFSRPEDIYIHVRVTYTIYDEEVFPSAGEDLIKSAILKKASKMDIGEDVIPKRFYGGIYSDVSGIEDLVVEMAKTVNPEDSPVDFSEDPISIAFKEKADFVLARIEVVSP